jgi:hypothetical protein
MPAKKRGTKKTNGGNDKHEKKMGGAGAAEHGINVFGGIGEQGPVSVNDNTIALKNITGGSRKGGSMLVEVGTPLVLTGLNQYMKRRSAKKGGNRMGRKSSKRGKKVRMGGKPKSRKMMKNKMGGKRRSMKKKGRKMRGGELTSADGSSPVEKNEEEEEEHNEIEEDGEQTAGGDENLNVTLPPGSMSGGENLNVTLPPASN